MNNSVNIGYWHIGIATQLGFILAVIGLLCAVKPYQTAKWHQNDPDIQKRLHKRAQSHRRKKDRVKFDPSNLDCEKEPAAQTVIAVRVIGFISLGCGVLLIIWSFL